MGVRLLDLAGSHSKVTYTNHFDGVKTTLQNSTLAKQPSSPEKVDINVYIMS